MRFVRAVLSIAILGAFGTSCAPAPAFPYPWFIEHIQLGPLDLPGGVSVELVPRDPPVVLSAENIVVRNSSSTALYVIGTHGIANPNYEGISVKLAPGIGPLNMIVDGQAFKWDLEFDDSKPSYYFTWVPEDNHNQSDSVWLDTYIGNVIGSDMGVVFRLKPLNQYGDQRPANVAVPEPQEAVLPLIYGIQELSIPLTISYSLSDAYQPAGAGSLSDYVSPQMLPCLLIVGLYLLGAWMIWHILGSVRRSS